MTAPHARTIRPFNDAPETQAEADVAYASHARPDAFRVSMRRNGPLFELRANLRAAWSELNQAQANLDRVVPRDCPFMDPRRAPTLAPCVNRRADRRA